MFRSALTAKAMLISMTVLLLPITAAAAGRTWVSGVGDDVNPCSRTSPCKTYAGAISRTDAGGEINTLTPGGFGMFTIGKSITVNGAGTLSAILGGGSQGILINITATTDASKTVRLRGLSINGMGTTTDGIKILAARQVFIEDVVMDGMTRHGINVSAAGAYVSVLRTEIRNAAKFGINLEPTGNAATANLAIEASNVSACEAGLYAGRGGTATARNSTFLRNGTGVATEGGSEAVIENCLVAHGDRGLMARQDSVIRISLTTVTKNQAGVGAASGGRIVSFKNNIIHGNTTDGAPTHTLSPS